MAPRSIGGEAQMKAIFAVAAIAASTLVLVQPAAAQTGDTACKSGSWTVYFDFDSDKVTPQGAAVLEKVAAKYKTCGDVQVIVSGHTDRKGDASYNVGLSQRMANNVRSYLVDRGVAPGNMTTQAFGETRPHVSTPDGASEPKNRRVEITFGPGSGW
jgi:OOP family OmpA-OmpF porin